MSNSDAWNREWKSSRQVRSLESEINELEPSSRLGIGNEGVRAKFRRLQSGMEEFELSQMHGIGNRRVRYKFEAWNREWMSSRLV